MILNAPKNYELDRCQCNQNLGSPNTALIHEQHSPRGIVCPSDEIYVDHTGPSNREGLFLSTRQADLPMGGEHPDPFSSQGRVMQRHVVHAGELAPGFGPTCHLIATGSQVDIWQEIFYRV
jgi:hypothetical protein